MIKLESETAIEIEAAGNPYLTGAFAPIGTEITADELSVRGEIPKDLDGVYLRNGPNPWTQPRGRYHWFDGDGMIHAVEFRNGKATYRNRFIRTSGFDAERKAGKSIWPGLRERPDPRVPHGSGSDGWLKDTANTDLAFHNGHALALWYQCGLPYKLDGRTLETLGTEDFGGRFKRTMSAHCKADEHTGELIYFDYSTQIPFLTYNVVSKGGDLVLHEEIDLPGPRLPHDMAITENYSILMDLPLFWDPELLQRQAHKVTYYPELPSRFGIIPRLGKAETIRWFQASPCYIYHVVNAWEEGDEIIMDACRVLEAAPKPEAPKDDNSRMLSFLKLAARMHRWRFNLKSGATREEPLDDANTEFPTINRRVLGRKSRFAYNVNLTYTPALAFDGLTKYDLQKGTSERYDFGAGRFGSEAPFAPRVGSRCEDDGYVVTFVTDANSGRSEVLVLGAQDFGSNPIARIEIPQRVPLGFHALWIPGEKLN
jgi:carotenoid cleavage dioxygenase-like enzyme